MKPDRSARSNTAEAIARKHRASLAAKQLQDRVARARAPSRDYQRCYELALQLELPPEQVADEFEQRAASREYTGVQRDDAERLAWEDVLERFRVEGYEL